jgi:hypothetical protein
MQLPPTKSPITHSIFRGIEGSHPSTSSDHNHTQRSGWTEDDNPSIEHRVDLPGKSGFNIDR